MFSKFVRVYRSPEADGGAPAPAADAPAAEDAPGDTYTEAQVTALVQKRVNQAMKNLPRNLANPKYAAARAALVADDSLFEEAASKRGGPPKAAKPQGLDPKALEGVQAEWSKTYVVPVTNENAALKDTVAALSSGYVAAEITRVLPAAGFQSDEDTIELFTARHGKLLSFDTATKTVVVLDEDGDPVLNSSGTPKTALQFFQEQAKLPRNAKHLKPSGQPLPSGKPQSGAGTDMSKMSAAEKIAAGLRARGA